MKSELDALRERGEEVIRAADPASPIFTPRHAAALCGFFVEALEEQRRWMQQAVAGGGQKWATVQQLAERFGYKDASGMYRLLADIRAAGFKVRSLRADAVRLAAKFSSQHTLLIFNIKKNGYKDPQDDWKDAGAGYVSCTSLNV